ncbi:MAG: hypothetical protein U0872_16420 [Planctomycetaceae bacterium]
MNTVQLLTQEFAAMSLPEIVVGGGGLISAALLLFSAEIRGK